MFSIIIVIRDNFQVSSRCLESVLSSDYDNFELIIVNNGGGAEIDDLIKDIKQKAEIKKIGIKTIKNNENIGAPAARNQAIKIALGDIMVFLDNDVFTEDVSWLKKFEMVMNKASDAAGIGPKLVYPNKRHLIQCAGGGINSKGRVLLLGRGQNIDLKKYNCQRVIQFYPTACLCVRKHLVLSVGGFDEKYFPVQYEDVDLCYKIRQLGYKFYYNPDIVLFHYENTTSKFSTDSRFIYNTAKNGWRFKDQWLKVVLGEQDQFSINNEEVNWNEISA